MQTQQFVRLTQPIVHTARLMLVPLTLSQFALLLEDPERLENVLALRPSGTRMNGHTKQAMEDLYQEALAHKTEYLWYTNWQIILKQERLSIGSACFKGLPNEQGEVEVGYGLNEAFCGLGYMTEAIQALDAWALMQPHVHTVIAETEKDNFASHKVLERCGMQKFMETQDAYLWHIKNR